MTAVPYCQAHAYATTSPLEDFGLDFCPFCGDADGCGCPEWDLFEPEKPLVQIKPRTVFL